MHSTRTQLAADISPDARSTVNRLNIPKRLGDYTLGRELARSSARESSSPVIGAWAFDNDELLTVTQAGEIRVGKLSSDQSQLVGQHPSRILTAQITPDRHQLLTSDEDGITRQWDIPSRSLIRNLDVTGSHSIGSDNLTVISSIGADKLGIWDLRSG